MTIIDHLEQYLGKIEQGWKDSKSDEGIQIVAIKNSPYESVSTLSSLGMSNKELDLSETKRVRQELIFSTYSMDVSENIVSFLLSLCEAIINRKKAVLRGEVIPLSSQLEKRIGFSAVYCAIPVLFDDTFAIYAKTCPSTVMVWIIPIHQNEVDYIKNNGWEAFESLLEEADPDLCSLKRSSIA